MRSLVYQLCVSQQALAPLATWTQGGEHGYQSALRIFRVAEFVTD